MNARDFQASEIIDNKYYCAQEKAGVGMLVRSKSTDGT